MNAFAAYSTVAGVSALASLLISFGAIRTLSQITDAGMWAIAAMTSTPALMAMGVSFFINASYRADPGRERPRLPDDRFDSGAFTAGDR